MPKNTEKNHSTDNLSTQAVSFLKEVYTDQNQKVLHFNDNVTSSELNIFYSGSSQCPPGHIWGPAIRNHYVIHYIVKGKGRFKFRKQEYELSANQGFLICPDEISTYWADDEDPWEYIWIGFHGLKAKNLLALAGLDGDHPVFSFTRGNQLKVHMMHMLELSDSYTHSTNLRIQSLLYQVFAELVENQDLHNSSDTQSLSDDYVKKAIDYITGNYMKAFTVQDLADYVRLNRSYFTKLFHSQIGMSPKKYLNTYRLNQAGHFLRNSKFSINEIALMTGFNDSLSFRRAFKETYGITPRQFRAGDIHQTTPDLPQ